MYAKDRKIRDRFVGLEEAGCESPGRKALPALLALLLLALNVTACGDGYTNSNPGGKKYPFLVEVSLQPTTSPSIAVAGTVAVRADAAYQVSSQEVDYTIVTSSASWSSSNPAVATVDQGLVTGTGTGSTTISASFDGKTGTTLVVVGQAPSTVDITPTGPFSLSAGTDLHFKASASYSDGSVLDLTNYTTWNSSAPEILQFYNDPLDFLHGPGEAALLATGTTTLTATLDTGEEASVDVMVVP